MTLARMLVATIFGAWCLGVSALKMRTKSLEGLEDFRLSACLKEVAQQVVKELSSTSVPITMQATCHSFSGVNMQLQNKGSKIMSVINCNAFSFDAKTNMVTVEPGVRYLDTTPTLRKHHVFLPHGNYGGQTIVGLLATGTHGVGTNPPHNFIKEMLVINGLGVMKLVTPISADFSAWQIHMGVLGVVLRVTLGPLLPEFNMKMDTATCSSVDNGIDVFTVENLGGIPAANYNKFTNVLFVWNSTISIFVPDMCLNNLGERTTLPLSPSHAKEDGTGCCQDVMNPDFKAVTSSVDGDLFNGLDREPVAASSYNCREEFIKLHEFPGGRAFEAFDELSPDKKSIFLDNMNAGYEWQMPFEDVPKFKLLTPAFLERAGPQYMMAFHGRWTPMDFAPAILSPYKSSAMVNFEFMSLATSRNGPVRTKKFLVAYEWFCNSLRLMGVNFRLAIGKAGMGTWLKQDGLNAPAWPVHDMLAFNFFKIQNDPKSRFSNLKWEAYKKAYGL